MYTHHMASFVETICPFFESQGFTKKTSSREPIFVRKGKSLNIFPYEDYFFFHTNKEIESDLLRQHESDRILVNEAYRLPRAMRWTVPNIVSLFLFDHEVPTSLHSLTKLPVKDGWGGEIHQISLVDTKNKIVYTSDDQIHYINVQGISFRSRLPERVDPTIRANELLKAMMNEYIRITH